MKMEADQRIVNRRLRYSWDICTLHPSWPPPFQLSKAGYNATTTVIRPAVSVIPIAMNTPLPAAQRVLPGTLTPRMAAPPFELVGVDDPPPPFLLVVPVGLLVTVPELPVEAEVGAEVAPRVLQVS